MDNEITKVVEEVEDPKEDLKEEVDDLTFDYWIDVIEEAFEDACGGVPANYDRETVHAYLDLALQSALKGHLMNMVPTTRFHQNYAASHFALMIPYADEIDIQQVGAVQQKKFCRRICAAFESFGLQRIKLIEATRKGLGDVVSLN